MNGIEVLTAFRRELRLAKVSVVVTTGTATSTFDLRYLGPLSLIRKPFDSGRLLATIACFSTRQGNATTPRSLRPGVHARAGWPNRGSSMRRSRSLTHATSYG